MILWYSVVVGRLDEDFLAQFSRECEEACRAVVSRIRLVSQKIDSEDMDVPFAIACRHAERVVRHDASPVYASGWRG